MSSFDFTMKTPKIGILSPDMLKFFFTILVVIL